MTEGDEITEVADSGAETSGNEEELSFLSRVAKLLGCESCRRRGLSTVDDADSLHNRRKNNQTVYSISNNVKSQQVNGPQLTLVCVDLKLINLYFGSEKELEKGLVSSLWTYDVS